MRSSSRVSRWGWVWLALPVATALGLHLIPAVAQQPAAPAAPAAAPAAPVPPKMANFPAPAKAALKTFGDLFVDPNNGAVGQNLPLVTQVGQFRVGELTDLAVINGGPTAIVQKRNEYRQQLINRASRLPNKELHQALNKITIETAMPLVLDKDVHPASRYNLLYLVGSLDRVEREGAAPPVALPEGTAALLEVLKTASPAFLQACAAEQLVRHAEYETTAPQRVAIVTVTKRYLTETAPADFDPVGWMWLRKRSANIVQLFAEKGSVEVNDPAIIVGLGRLLADGKATLNTRCDAAMALGAFDGKQITATNQTKEMVIALGDTLKVMLRECSDADNTRPLIAHALHYLALLSDGLRRPDFPTKGLVASATDQAVKSVANGLANKMAECDTKIRPKPPARADNTPIGVAQIQVMQTILGEVEQMLAPLGGNPIAAAPAAAPAPAPAPAAGT